VTSRTEDAVRQRIVTLSIIALLCAAARTALGQSADIVAVNGKRVDTLSSFVAELDRAGIGNSVDLTVARDDVQRHVKVQVIDLER